MVNATIKLSAHGPVHSDVSVTKVWHRSAERAECLLSDGADLAPVKAVRVSL